MTNQAFGRGQVEHALWLSREGSGAAAGRPSANFQTRIKRFLEADRALVPPRDKRLRFEPAAFTELAPEGGQLMFSHFDAFCLGLALRMASLGFKRHEVTLFIRALRRKLRPLHRRILRSTAEVRRLVFDPAASPKFKVHGASATDPFAYLVFRRVELLDTIRFDAIRSGPEALISAHGALILEGRNALLVWIGSNPGGEAIVLEIGAEALLLRTLLLKAPEIRRGRPAKGDL